MRARSVLVPAIVLGIGWVACGEPISHIYFGRLYDRDADCLYPGTPVDFALEGPPVEGGSCAPICISDNDGSVWVSVQCPPYPLTYDLTGKNPECPGALSALCRECPIDGGGIQTVCDAGPPPKDATPKDATPEAKGDGGSEHDGRSREDAKHDHHDGASDGAKD